MKSTEVGCQVLGLHIHLPLTTHSEQLPVLQASFMLSALHRCIMCYLSYCIFTVPLLYLDTFRYTNTDHCVTVVYSIQ